MTTRHKRPFRLVSVTAGALALGLLAGPALAADGSPADKVAKSDAATQRPDDRTIALVVDDQLWDDPAVPGHLIDVESIDGIVTLSGRVPHLLAKTHAVKSAETIRGVRAVIDRIEVDPEPIDDADLRTAIVEALALDPATDSYEVGVAVSNGVVTLSGTVDSWAEKELCRDVAAGVRGVREVRDAVATLPKVDRPDSEILQDVTRRIEMDVWVDAEPLDVDVSKGKVEITGSVASLSQRTRLSSRAWVAGVREVDMTGVEVKPEQRDEMKRGPIAKVPDARIEAAVRDAFLHDPRVLSYQPDVDVKSGLVTLTGTVGDLAAKRAAEEDARNTRGVWGVRNQLRVRLPSPLDDALLRRDVRTAIRRDPYVDVSNVTVSVLHGKVHLLGNVYSTFERERAEVAAERVAGVMDIDNRLAVAPVTVMARDDLEIHHDIEQELAWSPFVDADDIEVSVENGVATLTGAVGTWHERRIAGQNAREGGAVSVLNRLAVRGATTIAAD